QGDLHTRDIIAVPNRLQETIGKAEIEKILDWFLAEEMIDAANGRLGEELVDRTVQRLRRKEVAPEGFFDNDATAFCAARFGQAFRDSCKHARRYSEIMQRPLGLTKNLTQAFVRGLIAVIPIDVLKAHNKLSEGIGVELTVLLNTVASPILQLVQV